MKIIHDEQGGDYGWKNVFLAEKLSDQTKKVLLEIGFVISNVDDDQLGFSQRTLCFSTASIWQTESTSDFRFVIGWDDLGKPILKDHAEKKEEDLLPF